MHNIFKHILNCIILFVIFVVGIFIIIFLCITDIRKFVIEGITHKKVLPEGIIITPRNGIVRSNFLAIIFKNSATRTQVDELLGSISATSSFLIVQWV